jgi:hypothetical protein
VSHEARAPGGPPPVDLDVEHELPGYLWLWFAVIGGQAAWAIALLTAYPMVQVACETGLPILVHLVRWSAAIVSGAATAAGFLAWRRIEGLRAAHEPLATARHVQRARLMAFAGMLLSAAALLFLVLEDIATWVIDPCL